MTARAEILAVTRAEKGWVKKRLSSRAARLGIVLAVVFAAILIAPPFLQETLAQNISNRLQPPSGAHWFGTDNFGRDVFARVVQGARVSLTVGATASLFALIAGGLYGAAAAMLGPRVDRILMRLLEVVLAFPGAMLAIVLAIALGPGFTTVVTAIAIVFAAPIARLVRGLVLEELKQDYVTAAALIGSSRARILFRHITLNVAGPVLVYMMIVAGESILVEAGLSFLGAGLVPPTPSLGAMITEGQSFLIGGKWWLSVFAGVTVAAIVLSLNTVADVVTREMREGAGR